MSGSDQCDHSNSSVRKTFVPWIKIPLVAGVAGLFLLGLITVFPSLEILAWPALGLLVVSLLYFVIQTIARLVAKRWKSALFAFLRLTGLAAVSLLAIAAMVFYSMFGPSEDGFADDLTIPEDLEISVPGENTNDPWAETFSTATDEMQLAIQSALAIEGREETEFTPSLPSLRRAATDHPKEFRAYLEASPDWHIFLERGNRFASRRWSYNGEPRDTLHGYISSFGGDSGFQTRCLLCLDRKQWSHYKVQRAEEGTKPVKPQITNGNHLRESRVMIECGKVWLEIFEQSKSPERRITKATIGILEKEFSEFNKDPAKALTRARNMSRVPAGKDSPPLRLANGMQPGIYEATYSLNPGEPGSVYLKAFEITKGTALSEQRLKEASSTRPTWSDDPTERFNSKVGFTIYEGDWGKPYAARFEVWFKPDSGKSPRKLAQRNFKIEGWMR